jgi:hypothetical protein
MPDNLPQTPAPSATDAGLDVPFAQLFGGGPQDVTPTTSAPTTPETPQVTATADPIAPQTQDGPAPQSTSQSLPQAFELKTKTGTVYKSMDDAVSGIEHKDTLISQLRQFAMERTGIDPLTGQPVAPQVPYPHQPQMQQPQQMQPQMGQPQQPQGYLNNPQQYFSDLYEAYSNNDPQKYFATQQRLIEEQTQAQYAPYIGMLMEQSKTNAVAKVGNEVKDFGQFYGSNAYRETLQKFPALANAISVSENNAQYVHQLGDLYKMVHQLHQAATLPELIKQQQAAIPPQQPVRPTTQATHVTPPQQIAVPRNPNLTDDSQRRAVIEAFEKSGKADAQWRR